ncbi:hypothetical protein [Pararhodospirillum oryzae]|uniref:HEPN domain-containing protein n=1 Tax=Pararhodospirillum oryzae TaxID=478448 RepID=A0A512HBA3_9PROT|nr:hypothetical protein [Pararhodospirillum oryzae]GEO82734.1 hypothetical protein ROR02_28650 [Pararhodospirillum oryzae]
MPDVSLAKELIATAQTLVHAKGKRKPKQADLRRAVSTAYYAVFHALARVGADSLVGTSKSARPNRAWVEVYRSLDHGSAKTACQAATNISFPQGIKNFADAFVQLQNARHEADYNPMIRLNKMDTLSYIALAEDGINTLNDQNQNDKRAFAVWVLMSSKGVQQARNWSKRGNIRTLT